MINIRSSIEFIISVLKCHDITSLNTGINGGKIGYAVLIMATFQKYGVPTVDTSHIDIVRNIINESLSKIHPTVKGFMTGNSGIIWGLRKLYNMGVIEQSERFDRFTDIIIQHGLSNFYSQSKSITTENEIYPWGITLLQFWNGTDTLTRYLYEEKILLCLIECERILNGDEPYSFLSADKNCALLHSILYTASKAYALGIGSVRAKRLVDNVTTRDHIVIHYQNSADAAILNALIRKESVCIPYHADSLAYLGTIAMVYDMPELFLPTYKACNIGTDAFAQMAPEELIGIGSGLYATMETNNLTIIIPIRIDSDVRLRNLTAVVMYYNRLKLPLLLIEADECSRIDFDKSYTQVRHIFISDSNPIFHRTKYINLGLRSITTPHAAIIDADVIVPSYQLKQANQLLNHTPMILPYDGRFIHMPHSLGDIFRNTASFKDIQTHYESNKTDYMFGYHSVGGAYLVNVDLYRQCGWENEYFTGWGPEDFERVQRMDILGFPVTRIRGVIYHLDHPRGINSGNSPYDLAFSTRKEYCKVCNMTANELRTYIHTWPWTYW